MKEKGNFKEGKISRLILAQAVPLTLAQLVQLIYNIVDRIYLGHIPGDTSSLALRGGALRMEAHWRPSSGDKTAVHAGNA